MTNNIIDAIKDEIGYTEESVSCGLCVHHAAIERSGEWHGECYIASNLVKFNVDSEVGHCDRWELKQ